MDNEWVAEKKLAQEALVFGTTGNGFQTAMDLDADFGPETNVDFVEHINGDIILPDKKSLKEEKKSKFDRDSEEEDEEEEEDERWDYIKGDVKGEDSLNNKEFNNHQQIDGLDHALNPNAAEFVPTSPVEKSSSVSVPNPGLKNNVPFSPDACKSAFFENSVCDLNNTNYNCLKNENETNGIEKHSTDVNNFKGTNDSDSHSTEAETDLIDHSSAKNHINDQLLTELSCDAVSPIKPNSHSESPFPNSSEVNHTSEAESSALSDDHELSLHAPSVCEESVLYSDISTEKPHDFSDPVDSPQLNNLEYSVISPEKPHEFTLLENASKEASETTAGEGYHGVNGADVSDHIDPLSVQADAEVDPFDIFKAPEPKIDEASNNLLSSNEELECNKDNLDQFKTNENFFSPDEAFEHKKDHLSELRSEGFAHSPDQPFEPENKTNEHFFSPDEAFEHKKDHLSKLRTEGFVHSPDDPFEPEKANLSKDKTNECVFSSSSFVEDLQEPQSINCVKDEEVTQETAEVPKNIFNNAGIVEQLEVRNEEDFSFDSTGKLEGAEYSQENSGFSNFEVPKEDNLSGTTCAAEDFFKTDAEQSFKFNDFEARKDVFENLQNVTNTQVEEVKDVYSNPFMEFSTSKEREADSVSVKVENIDLNLSGIAELPEKTDDTKIEEVEHKTEEVKQTEDVFSYQENTDFTQSSVVTQRQENISVTAFENPFSEQISEVSENIKNLNLTESSHTLSPMPFSSNESSNISEPKEAGNIIDFQNDQALISKLTNEETFSNAEDVVNKLTEEFETSRTEKSITDMDSPEVSIVADSTAAAVGVTAGVVAGIAAGVAAGVVADKSKKPATTPQKTTTLKTDAKSIAAKSKPAAKSAATAQPAAKPTAKSPTAASKKPIPPKASPAKTSVNVARATPSMVLKSKVGTTTAAAPLKKPATTSTLKPKAPLSSRPLPSASTAAAKPKPATTSTIGATKPSSKPLSNGVPPRTTTLTKRPATAPAASRTPAASTTTTKTPAPKPAPRTVPAPRLTATAKSTATTTAKSSVPSKPASSVPARKLISSTPKVLDRKEPTKPANATPRTTLAAKKLDPKKMSASQSNGASNSQTKPPPIKRMPPKINQTEPKKETVVENGVDSKDSSAAP